MSKLKTVRYGFEDGKAKVKLNDEKFYIDKTGKRIE